MQQKLTYNHTIIACFIGYIVQAIVNNFVPLLFLTFHKSYGIPMSSITLLITFNFGLQLLIDFLSAGFIDRIGYRASAILAHVFASCGLILLTILPDLLPDPFVGLLIAVMVYAVGGGLLEVLVSPIVEACPTDHKESAMSLLHSFYCWGHVGVVLLSTAYFAVFGTANWKYLALIWAVIPLANAVFFSRVPIASLISEGETGMTLKELAMQKIFWVMMLLMVCAGACEQAVSQWASALAEAGLGVSKSVGDLAGPMLFAVLMGTSRALYGKFGEKLPLRPCMILSGILCGVSYLLISLSPSPLLAFAGCGLCGFSVGILWPGTFSMASAALKRGGTLMFAMLALAGDLGCSGGPTYVGFLSGIFDNNLKMGILFACIFPVLLLLGIFLLGKMRKPLAEKTL
ncbi:MAG: MFS transporter [Fusicatenibacter sp.]|nr:MFS transporter [Lachnospiraceae bacterium]MDY2937875.1 MFS transporter [Fusicatenibacter sp.]